MQRAKKKMKMKSGIENRDAHEYNRRSLTEVFSVADRRSSCAFHFKDGKKAVI